MLLTVHKDLTDGLDLPTIARHFVDANERLRYFFGTVHSPQRNPPERLGLTVGTVRLELFGNLTECILLYTMPMTTVYMTIDYMTVADTRLAPINEKTTTFVYSFHLC